MYLKIYRNTEEKFRREKEEKKKKKLQKFKGKGTLMSYIKEVLEVHFWLCGNLFGILN